jgi:alpha-1,6-mannosyltransferase
VLPPNVAARRIQLLGLASAAAYVATYLSERALFFNGLVSNVPLVEGGQPASPGAAMLQGAVYILSTLVLFGLYAGVLSLCHKGALEHGAGRGWALGLPVLLNLAFVFSLPRLSRDALSYMAHGYLGHVGNPLLEPMSDVMATPLGSQLAGFAWRPIPAVSPYGILWTRLEMAILSASTDVRTAVLLFKAVSAVASLSAAACLWSFLGRVHPRAQMLGTLAYLWNPLIIIEFASEGHNDAVVILFVLAALAASARGWRWVAVFALFLGVLTKYIPVMLGPAMLVYLWKTRRGAGRFALEVVIGLTLGAIVAALLFAPLWAGLASFRGILQRGSPLSSLSPIGIVNWVLRRSPLRRFSGALTLTLATIPFVLFSLWASLKAKDLGGLAKAFVGITLAYVLVASPDYWPWYTCLPVALLAAAAPESSLWAVGLLALGARLCAPADVLFQNGFVGTRFLKGSMSAMGTTVPLIAGAAWALSSWRARRRVPRP